jgi:hypothetical protein
MREEDFKKSSGPIARVLLALTIAACLLAVATGVYGIYNFPDAPIRQTGNGYAGKHGKPRTAEEFEKFVLWQKVMFVVFPAAFIFGFGFAIADSRRRKNLAQRRKGAKE